MTRSDPLNPRRRIRLIPVLIVGAVVLLGVRAGELGFGLELSPTRPALAAGEDKADAPADKRAGASVTAPASKADKAAADDGRRTTDFPVEFTPAEVAVLQDLANRRDELLQLEKELDARERLLNAAGPVRITSSTPYCAGGRTTNRSNWIPSGLTTNCL